MKEKQMTQQDKIFGMARQSHLDVYALGRDKDQFIYRLEAFAKLVRNDYSNKHAQLWLKRIDEAVKAEREACAKLSHTLPNPYKHCEISAHDYDMAIVDYSRAIRARGNT